MVHSLGCTDSPRLPTPAEGKLRWGVTRERVQSLLFVIHRGAFDTGPQLLSGRGGRVRKRRARVDDRAEPGLGRLAADADRSTANLPEAAVRRELVRLD